MRWTWGSVLVALAVLAAAPAGQAATKPPTRYSLVHGCYALKKAIDGKTLGGAGRIRMQATALGRYLLYRPDGTFLAAQEDGSVAPAAEPSPAADWRVRRAGPRGLFRLDPQSGKLPILSVRFVRAKRCAVFPEAALDARGKPKRGSTSFGRVGGLVEGHMHWMTFE
jgi:hypothetical protein